MISCMNLLDHFLSSWLEIKTETSSFQSIFCEQRHDIMYKPLFTFSERQAFSLMWKYCLPHSKYRIPTNIALWIIKSKMHSYPFNVSNLVKIFEDCVVRSSVGKCAALFICDNNPLGHAFMFNILSATDLMSSGGKCHFRNEFRQHSVFTYMQLQCLSALWLLR